MVHSRGDESLGAALWAFRIGYFWAVLGEGFQGLELRVSGLRLRLVPKPRHLGASLFTRTNPISLKLIFN